VKDTYADRIWRSEVKSRDGWRCRWPDCGRRSGLEVHHVFSRGYSATKTDPDNGVTLCGEHHPWAQQNTVQFNDWWARIIGPVRFAELRARALSCNGKLVPRPEAVEEAVDAPPAGRPGVVHALLSSPGVPDPQKPVGLAMALITVEVRSAAANDLCREINNLHPDELKSVVLILAGAARGAIAAVPKPEEFRAGLALNLLREAQP
jgi:hypothetical protein